MATSCRPSDGRKPARRCLRADTARPLGLAGTAEQRGFRKRNKASPPYNNTANRDPIRVIDQSDKCPAWIRAFLPRHDVPARRDRNPLDAAAVSDAQRGDGTRYVESVGELPGRHAGIAGIV